MKEKLLLVFLTCAAICSLVTSYPAFRTYMVNYDLSSECIKGFTDAGIERSAIKVDGKDCSL